ncbi:M14 family metallopeptidase [Croceitalea sp. MTPC9]|uniref:M14 family metallopeptidase n=1 Tax=unclassified Croceitalea TaxID=2632280 RepID=UPI002B3ABD05|nr:M14 family metallopeptidase [Croceitalea sp. MTPC6]GMN18287.1 M14 family metallopeptidase [Croceitalea sp. MTPC9]
MKNYFFLVLLLLFFSCETTQEEKKASFKTVFEQSEGKETATYIETIEFYRSLAKEYPEINIQSIGNTDSGYPLHIVTFNADGNFNFEKIREDKLLLLINNGIHPGESDGIDATMLLFRDLADGTLEKPSNMVITTIPIYNIGGALNRNSTTRANQNGPISYGFRGNAQNYDLNRDFIKMDTKNAKSFAEIFHLIKPDIFIDNHVSNGADYQYTLTHLFTQHNKLGGSIGSYFNRNFRPELERKLKKEGWDITPYVNVFNKPPETGFSQFLDSPRYSTGYTTLWNTMGMMLETHMLKPYKKRVEGTYAFLSAILFVTDWGTETIKEFRKDRFSEIANAKNYYLNWQIDTTKSSTLNFKGYKVDTLISKVTGLPRLKYNRGMPFTKEVTYQNYFIPKDTVEIPAAYIFKKGWNTVKDRLSTNKIEFFELEKDTTLTVESYRIETYDTRKSAYEGHYLHYNTKVSSSKKELTFSKGDLVVPSNQYGIRYLLETLEPQAPDSFFNWNFFDTVLQQKEGFSPYVFEDEALKLLKENEELRNSFLLKKENEEQFAKNWYAQLDWVFKQSKYYEDAHMQYPVFRILKESPAEGILKD